MRLFLETETGVIIYQHQVLTLQQRGVCGLTDNSDAVTLDKRVSGHTLILFNRLFQALQLSDHRLYGAIHSRN